MISRLRVSFFLLCLIVLTAFGYKHVLYSDTSDNKETSNVTLIVLGTIQDAGSPHIACTKDCCMDLFQNPDVNRKVVSLGVIDNENNFSVLFEATPDIADQLKILKSFSDKEKKELPDAVFLTHAHIGHYTGLMYFGKEAVNADNVPVYAMPRMKLFLEENGPWSQLISTNNIKIHSVSQLVPVNLTPKLNVTPILVPHRDEYSETVGFIIKGPNKKALFIPDIDKWEKWDHNIIEEISKVDYAFIDATFYDGKELNNRDMSEIPHPFIVESMTMFSSLPDSEKSKIYFIHLNHTNPILREENPQYKHILNSGFNVAKMKDSFLL